MTGEVYRIKSNKNYNAAWRQDYVTSDLINALSSSVDVALQEAWSPQEGLTGLIGEEGRAIYADGPFDSQLIDTFRQRLGVKFGSLRNAFEVMDHNHDGLITYGELKCSLDKYGIPWTETHVRRDLRALFRALDIGSKAQLSLHDFVRGTSEDIALSEEQARASARGSPVIRKAMLLHQRPDWTKKLQRSNLVCHHLFELHEEHDVLPERLPSKKEWPSYDHRRPYAQVLERTEKHHERVKRTLLKHAERDEKLHAKEVTLKPKLLQKSLAMVGGKHVKPWEDRAHLGLSSRRQRVRSDVESADREQRMHETFQPTIVPKSRDLFRQFDDNGEDWHDRMYGRRRVERVVLDPKKQTREYKEEYLRERIPRLSPKTSARQHKAFASDMTPHEFLHRNYLSEAASPDSSPGRATMSASFLHRSNKVPRSTSAGSVGNATLSPMKLGFGDSSASTVLPQGPASPAAQVPPTRIVASTGVVDFLAGYGGYLKPLARDMSDVEAATLVQSRFRGNLVRRGLVSREEAVAANAVDEATPASDDFEAALDPGFHEAASAEATDAADVDPDLGLDEADFGAAADFETAGAALGPGPHEADEGTEAMLGLGQEEPAEEIEGGEEADVALGLGHGDGADSAPGRGLDAEAQDADGDEFGFDDEDAW